MLTRCKKTMDICTSRAFISGPAASTLIGQLAVALGPQAWIDGDVQPITLPRAVIRPPPNTPLTAPAHHLSTFTVVADRRTRDGHTPASSPAPPHIDTSMDRSNVVLPRTQFGEMRTAFESLAFQDLERRESLIDHFFANSHLSCATIEGVIEGERKYKCVHDVMSITGNLLYEHMYNRKKTRAIVDRRLKCVKMDVERGTTPWYTS
ncbi:hypothetical protein EV401DRAFT_1947502 [Pisolithus croceorrhizus]|nr:hypothetical protein EV401DRAFT_1947502 [Pisolithus croceorrhizus]